MSNQRTKPKHYGHPDLLSRVELAEKLQVSTSTVDLWTRKGWIPAIKHPVRAGHGTPVYFDWDAVQAALDVRFKPKAAK